MDVRWTKKGKIWSFGYKSYINIDNGYRFIRTWQVTNATKYDSQMFKSIYDPKNKGIEVYADTVYRSKKIE